MQSDRLDGGLVTYRLVSSSDVPCNEVNIFVVDSLNVKSCVGLSLYIKSVHLMHLPRVGMVVTTSPSFSLYSVVVFPAASRPNEIKGGYLEPDL